MSDALDLPETLRPILDHVIVSVEQESERLPSGLYLPERSQRMEIGIGRVISIGPGWKSAKTGTRSETDLCVGDRIVYETFRAVHKAERKIVHEDGREEIERFAILQERHVMGVIEGDVGVDLTRATIEVGG